MKLAIMQPYFLPYIGYYQLIGAVDRFVIYDNIKYTKKGWINRNRMLRNGTDTMFSLPLKAAPDHCDVVERELAADFDRDKLLNQLEGAYRKAPYFRETFPLIETIVRFPETNLFRFIFNSLERTTRHLGLAPDFVVSSHIPIDHGLRAADKVIAICKAMGATCYINPIGGNELYDSAAFASRGIELGFIRSRPLEYKQYGDTFVPWLSIVDVMMFVPVAEISGRLLQSYDRD